MGDEVSRAEVVLLEAEPLVQVRMARALTVGGGFAQVQCAANIIEVPGLLHDGLKLLMMPSQELELGGQYATARKTLSVASFYHEVNERTLQRLEEISAINHLIGWPDFLTSPRSWDIALAAKMTLSPTQECSWQTLLPGLSAHRRWPLYSSFERDKAIEEIGELVRRALLADRVADLVAEAAYEMAMNAMYDAPVDEFGRPKYSHDRQRDIALEDHEVPSLTLCSDGDLLALEILDPFGRLRRAHVLEGIRRGLGAKTANSAREVLNTSQGGAGLGIFRLFQLASALIVEVVKGERTRMIAVFDLGLRMRELRSFPTSIHLLFR